MNSIKIGQRVKFNDKTDLRGFGEVVKTDPQIVIKDSKNNLHYFCPHQYKYFDLVEKKQKA